MISEPCTVVIKNEGQLTVNQREVMRYLKTDVLDESLLKLYDDCVKLVKETAVPRAVYITADISVTEDTVDFGFMTVNSKSLAKNLSGCRYAYIFAATLGIEIDRLINKYIAASPSKCSMIGAVSSSYIESVCDYVNALLVEGKEARPRFSAGYGDFALDYQRDITNALEVNKRLGITLTDAMLMVPIKSVSAVIGIK